MARPKGSKNKQKDGNGEIAGIGHNVAELTDEQQQKLTIGHVQGYKKFLGLKKAADAQLKNYCKTIKSDGIKLSAVKLMIDLETPEGEANLRERMEEQAKIARWAGMPIGAQGSLFDDEDSRSEADRAYEAGKRAGLGGENRDCPYKPGNDLHERWHDGYQAGQEVKLGRGIRPLTDPLADADAEATAH